MESKNLASRQFYGSGIPGVNPAEFKGAFIVIEGADGSGRSTQISGLRNWLELAGFAVEITGLSRSDLVAEDLEKAKQGHTLLPTTLSLYYATDFADRLENKIFPALRSGFVVLADRYIYSLIARTTARGVDSEWIKEVYGIALVPDAVFYLDVPPTVLAERNFRKNFTLDYWESGMDIRHSGDMYECFLHYQKQLQKIFKTLQKKYEFEIINGNRNPSVIQQELRRKIKHLLNTDNGQSG